MNLTSRWTPLMHHPVQQAYWASKTRFNISHAGRRSGKTELAKRKLVKRALSFSMPGGRFVFGAPTHRQVTKIYWDDVKALVPIWALENGKRSISESLKTIRLKNSAIIELIGMDEPARIEGPPLDGFVGDEFGNFKPKVWSQNVRPALSTIGRPGWADLIGVPEGKNHYFQLAEDAKELEDWSVFTWTTYELNPGEADKAKGELDELTYQQEYDGRFVSFKGRAYYCYDKSLHVPPEGQMPQYVGAYPLILCHDFNRIPGTCVIVQELPSPDWLIIKNAGKAETVSVVLDEIFFQQDSTTEKVCDEIIRRWKIHRGDVHLYGDASGGAKTSQGVQGSDWDIIHAKLSPVFKLRKKYPRANPHVRPRINAVNSRLKSADGHIRVLIHPKCKYLQRDLESVTCDDAGDIEKGKEAMLTHISDGFGYYLHSRFSSQTKVYSQAI